ncbi:MAG: hypothetical protein KGR98_13970, partial [Verrucomicrobia bacterium]|nr:hypothetical protein [Verrucomicrobiota bacterium]
GGFADSYNEIRAGKYIPGESFTGDGGEISQSVYHLFNPGERIPLNFVLRGLVHYSAYDRNQDTDAAFQLPSDRADFDVRAGLRWGGVEPTLFPAFAMELSIWYEGEFRTEAAPYGFDGDRAVQPNSHLFWAEAALSYTLPKSRQNFYVRLTAGTSVHPDRFSAYRLGGFLPLSAEFPLSLPGYFYQEISARQFILINGNYIVPLDYSEDWNLYLNASSAAVSYLAGEGQPGDWVSGVGCGIQYRSPSSRWKIMLTYAYGIDAIRDGGRGAHSIGLLMQWDLGHLRGKNFAPVQPSRWLWQWLFQ